MLLFICLVMSNSAAPLDCSPPGSSVHGILQPRILEWGSHFLLQGLFMTQGLNPHLLHCKWILYCWATREAPLSIAASNMHSPSLLLCLTWWRYKGTALPNKSPSPKFQGSGRENILASHWMKANQNPFSKRYERSTPILQGVSDVEQPKSNTHKSIFIFKKYCFFKKFFTQT